MVQGMTIDAVPVSNTERRKLAIELVESASGGALQQDVTRFERAANDPKTGIFNYINVYEALWNNYGQAKGEAEKQHYQDLMAVFWLRQEFSGAAGKFTVPRLKELRQEALSHAEDGHEKYLEQKAEEAKQAEIARKQAEDDKLAPLQLAIRQKVLGANSPERIAKIYDEMMAFQTKFDNVSDTAFSYAMENHEWGKVGLTLAQVKTVFARALEIALQRSVASADTQTSVQADEALTPTPKPKPKVVTAVSTAPRSFTNTDYTVQKGDELYKLAEDQGLAGLLAHTKQALGNDVDEKTAKLTLAVIIARKSGLKDADRLEAGDVLKLPTEKEIKDGIAYMKSGEGVLKDGALDWLNEAKGMDVASIVDIAGPGAAVAAAPRRLVKDSGVSAT